MSWLWWFPVLFRRLDVWLAKEQVIAFQGMYYVLFSLGGAAMLTVPGIDAAAGHMHQMLGAMSYLIWSGMIMVCPIFTLIGRKVTTRSANISPGEPNSAWGAAGLQFTGDSGVWAAINIFCYELFRYDNHWWSENLFLFLFLLMGVLGGFMFTFRSVRRLADIKRQEYRTRKSEQ